MGSVESDVRAQANVIGIVLLFAIVIAVSGSVIIIGGEALEARQQATSMEAAAQSMTQLDAQLSQVTSGAQTTVSLSDIGDGSAQIQGEAGHVTIEIEDSSGNTCTVVDRHLGRVLYEQGGQTLAYQGGGVFMSSDGSDGSTVVSPPDFQYRYRNGVPTLSMPLILIRDNTGNSRSQVQVDDGLTLQQASTQQQAFPASSCSSGSISTGGLSNPVEGDYTVRITIQSEYYEAWEAMFEQRTNANIHTEPANNEVTITIEGTTTSTAGPGTVQEAFSTSSSASITNVGQIDSYDSSNGPYPGWRAGEDATVGIAGDFSASASPTISGDLNVTGRLETSNNFEVYGETITGGSPNSGPVDYIDGGGSVVFHELFSTTDDLRATDGTRFGGDVIIGGALDTSFRPDYIGGNLYVHDGVPDGVFVNMNEVRGSFHAGDDVYLNTWNVDNTFYSDLYVDGDLYLHSEYVHFSGTNQEIHATGDVYINRSGTISADIYAGGDVHVGVANWQNPTVNGNIHAGGTIDNNGTINGNTYEGPSATAPTLPTLPAPPTPTVESTPPMTSAIATHRSEISSTNNNPGSPITAIETEGGCSSSCELTAGQYYLDDMEITAGAGTDPALELNTTNGDIEIFVENDITIKSEIEVTGSNQVRIYSQGDLTVEGGDADVSTPNDNATRFWMFLEPDASVTFQSGSPEFTGVVYGAGPSAGDGADIDMTNDATIYGALIGEFVGFNSNVAIHYDEALMRSGPNSGGGTGGGTTATTIGFFHVTTTTVEAEDS